MINIKLSRAECEELLKLVSQSDNIELELLDTKLKIGMQELRDSLSPIGYSRLRFNGLSKELIKEEYGITEFNLELLEMCHKEYLNKYNKEVN